MRSNYFKISLAWKKSRNKTMVLEKRQRLEFLNLNYITLITVGALGI